MGSRAPFRKSDKANQPSDFYTIKEHSVEAPLQFGVIKTGKIIFFATFHADRYIFEFRKKSTMHALSFFFEIKIYCMESGKTYNLVATLKHMHIF